MAICDNLCRDISLCEENLVKGSLIYSLMRVNVSSELALLHTELGDPVHTKESGGVSCKVFKRHQKLAGFLSQSCKGPRYNRIQSHTLVKNR